MKAISQKFTFLTVICAALLGSRSGSDAASEEFNSLFNARDLAGWKVPAPNPFWRVVDGVLVGENDEKLKGNVLYTERVFQNFVLEADAKWSGEIDSGFMFREPELQMQIGISRSLKTDMTASFYTGGAEKYPVAGRANDLEKTLKPNEWNQFRLEAKDDVFTVWVNGKKVTEYHDSHYPKPGPIGLQIHPGLKMKIEFRNIRIKEQP
jgi:hypothetical protein